MNDPKVFKNHPNLSDDINAKIAKSEAEGGVYVKNLPVGKGLRVLTRNTLYLIEKRADGVYISGNPTYCPNPARASIHGSTWGGSMLKVGFIGRGMHLEFSLDKTDSDFNSQCITTTAIQEVTEFDLRDEDELMEAVTPQITIKAMQKRAWRHAEDKGFHNSGTGADNNANALRLMLIVSELSEALEELRSGHDAKEVYGLDSKPEGFGVELADAIIRIGDLAETVGIDLDYLVQLKMDYNETRPKMHGGKAF